MLTKLREEDPFLRLSAKNTSASFRSSFVTNGSSLKAARKEPQKFGSTSCSDLLPFHFDGCVLVCREVGEIVSENCFENFINICRKITGNY